jgi:hypothetical protein
MEDEHRMGTIFNTQLVAVARAAAQKQANLGKRAFVDAAAASGTGGDPAAAGGDPMAAGGDPMAAMGGDPMAAGGDPMAAMGGGDPAAGGGAPPGDPRIDQLMSMMQQMMSQGGGGGGAAAGGGAMGGVEPIKPKIDVNVEIMRMNKMIARIADHLKIPIPASEMVATSNDLTQMGMQGAEGAAGGAGGGGAGAGPSSAIAPPSPIQAAMPMPAGGGGGGGGEKTSSRGSAVPKLASIRDMGNQAAAMATVLRAQLRT